MAKETKVVTLQVKGIALFPEVAGACVSRIIETGGKMKLSSVEVFMNSIAVRSEHESTDMLAAWASSLETELKDIVDRGPARPKHLGLPRSIEER